MFIKKGYFFTIMFSAFILTTVQVCADSIGSIRGMVYDKDFDVPLALAEVSIAETGQKVKATDEGNFVFSKVNPGKYTLVFSKKGYTRYVEPDVLVTAGQMSEVDVYLSGEFTEMEEFIVQDLSISGTEAGLLMLRVESPALLDSVSASLISQAGVSDAASALRLVSGATVQDGKYAVIRGLPDRYVNSQMNGVRLPTADADKRAVQLDQFPSSVIDSVQVSKTFTPDQQGDASGGAVNVVLKGIPDKNILKVKAGTSYNSQMKADDFLTYNGGGVNLLGKDDGSREIPADLDLDGEPDFGGAVGVSRKKAPTNHDFSIALGGKQEISYGTRVGAFANVYHKKYSSYFENGVDDSLWLDTEHDQEIGDPLMPRLSGQYIPPDQLGETSLFDVTEAKSGVKWGGLFVTGVETQNHSLNALFMQTHSAEDKAVLAEDIRGKQYFYPGHDPYDFDTLGHDDDRDNAYYRRLETLSYTERTTKTLQFSGEHNFNFPELGFDRIFTLLSPEADWIISENSASSYQPDKRHFAEKWLPGQFFGGGMWYVPAAHYPDKAGNFMSGNVQRIWEEITEESNQYSLNLKLPFTNWTEKEGYFKLGIFKDELNRDFDRESFSNQGQSDSEWPSMPGLADATVDDDSPFEDFFSSGFMDWDEREPFVGADDSADNVDVDYKGKQNIDAYYYMIDFPLTPFFKVIGGKRFETTKLTIINDPEEDADVVLPGLGKTGFWNNGERILDPETGLLAGDVIFEQKDIFPAYGFEMTILDKINLRGSYSETVARQTFKELSPIARQEYLGGDVFLGNPRLKMASLENKDLRFDYKPYEGGLISLSWFKKDVENPIEYVQRGTTSLGGYNTPVNFPEGELKGYEVEVRQDIGHLFNFFRGLTFGANATFIESEVILTEGETASLQSALNRNITRRDMLNAPHRLINLYLRYNLERFGTNLGLFYTIKGDTLILGHGVQSTSFIPPVYAEEYGTLNFTLSKKIGKDCSFKFSAKNLTNPEIREVYRSEYIAEEAVKTSYKKGMSFSFSLTHRW